MNKIQEFLNANKAVNRYPSNHFELSRIVEIETSYLNKIINGKHLPSIPLAKKIARALNTTIEQLF